MAATLGTPITAEEPPMSLRAYLQDLLRLELPMPLPDSGPALSIRRWRPRGRFNPSAIQFIDRHPEFWPGRDDVPIRRIHRLSNSARRGWRGIFQSGKMQRPMRHHTGIELGALRACEVDAAVSMFVEHPARIRVRVGQGVRTVLPAVYAERLGEPWFLLCRREEAAAKPDSAALWSQVGEALSAAGIGVEVVTESHCAQRPLAGSITTLLRGRWAEPVDAQARDLAIRAASLGSTVAQVCRSAGIPTAQVWALMLKGDLGVDARSTLDDDTTLSCNPFIDPVPLWTAP